MLSIEDLLADVFRQNLEKGVSGRLIEKLKRKLEARSPRRERCKLGG